MNGVTVNDLVNLVNVGELKINGRHTVFVTAQPDANQLDHINGAFMISMVNSHNDYFRLVNILVWP